MAVFAVSRAHWQLIEANRPRIEAKFRVSLQLSSYGQPVPPPGTETSDTGMTGTQDQPDSSTNTHSQGQMWVEVDGSGAFQAKDHIISLCHDHSTEEQLPVGFADLLASEFDEIAAKTDTRISRIPGKDTLILSGSDETILAIACSMVTEKCNILKRQQESCSNVLQMKDVHALSDYYLENQSLGRLCVESTQGNTPKDRESHDGTISPEIDLYGASSPTEMGRAVEGDGPPRLIAHSVAPVASTNAALQDGVLAVDVQINDTRTNTLINSMQKLGFSKDQVDLTLRQLGPNADHNDVLGALVKQRPTKTDLEESEDTKKEESVRPRDLSDGYSSTEGAEDDSNNLRPIIIDGSNVAMSFGNKDVFACKGIEIVVNWFCERGHKKLYVFVPAWRKEASKPDTPITDQAILTDLEKRNFLVWTPSRRINGRRIVCYDDRYILKTAVEEDGVIVSNDNFRDIQNERTEWRKVIEERLLMYSFVNDRFMPPDDPLGRHGPSLDNFLRVKPRMPDHPPQACPYGKKCTYGNKCKYYHADRPNRPMKSISDTLKERDKSRKERAKLNSDRSNSPRFSSTSSAPISGYVPPEEVGSSPERHTSPLTGVTNHQPSQRKTTRLASESSALQMSPRQAGSPRHLYTTESASKSQYSSSRDEVFRAPDLQQYQNTGVAQSHSQVPSQSLNSSQIRRVSHTAPPPTFPNHSERPPQRDMYTVLLNRYPSQNQSDRGYVQMEESLIRNRTSMPPVMYGSGEVLGATPSGMNFDRRSSHNELVPDFQRMGIHDQSGMMLPREPQHHYGYGQSSQQYHGGEQFPGQPLPGQRPGEVSQAGTIPIPYRSGESYTPRHQINSDPMRYTTSMQTPSPGYHPHSNPQPQPYNIDMPNRTAGWHSNKRPASSDHVSIEEQRRNIMYHLSNQFGREQAEAVMKRHPRETNPSKLIMYMSTYT